MPEFPKKFEQNPSQPQAETDFDIGFASGIEDEVDDDPVWTPEVRKSLNRLRLHSLSLFPPFGKLRMHPSFIEIAKKVLPDTTEDERGQFVDLFLKGNKRLANNQKPEGISPDLLGKMYVAIIEHLENDKDE